MPQDVLSVAAVSRDEFPAMLAQMIFFRQWPLQISEKRSVCLPTPLRVAFARAILPRLSLTFVKERRVPHALPDPPYHACRHCRHCTRADRLAYLRRWRQQNREHINAYRRAYAEKKKLEALK
jgi:hypothetical protein